jgi:protein-S-isoprenylcysteine O-methyltransferase Ste14
LDIAHLRLDIGRRSSISNISYSVSNAPRSAASGERRVADLLARVGVGALLTLLSVNLLHDFQRTHHVTGLLLLASESLVVFLMIFRRRARLIDRSAVAAIMTGLSVVGPPLLRAGHGPGLVPDGTTALVSALGLMLVVAGKLSLGRSFGIVPANRGVIVSGPYAFMRHPIYAGYLVTHAAFVVAHPTLRNVTILLVADAALVIRSLLEERLLSGDDGYRAYCGRVAWHLVPGVF